MNESNISMILGALVIVIVGILVVNYFTAKGNGSVSLSNGSSTTFEKTHTVIKGETLWSIAEDSYGSGYNWTDIYNANKLSSDKIEVGQKLTIPDVSPKQPTSTKVAASAAGVQNPITGSSYTVVKGDSLWNISVRVYGNGYKWVEIAKANNLKNPNLIHSGNVFTLPR